MIIELNDNDGDEIEELADQLNVDPCKVIFLALQLLSIASTEEGHGNVLAIVDDVKRQDVVSLPLASVPTFANMFT